MVVKHAEGYISRRDKGSLVYEESGTADESTDDGHNGEGYYELGEAQAISDNESEADDEVFEEEGEEDDEEEKEEEEEEDL